MTNYSNSCEYVSETKCIDGTVCNWEVMPVEFKQRLTESCPKKQKICRYYYLDKDKERGRCCNQNMKSCEYDPKKLGSNGIKLMQTCNIPKNIENYVDNLIKTVLNKEADPKQKATA